MTAPTIRWEAKSHAEIYSEVHTRGEGADHDLAVTVPWWQHHAADLGEVRSRYESAADRLLSTAEGTAARAATVATRLVTRELTEAQELTSLAGARRAVLNELNWELRAALPPPVPPVELGGFLREGIGWLLAPDFATEDAHRLNEEAVARDRMRAYEQAVTAEALANDGHRQDRTGAATPAGRSHGEATVPLGMRQLTGAAYPDFGPTGHIEPDEEPAAENTVLGTPPRERTWLDTSGPIRLGPVSPFDPDVRVAPPVIGA
jgi:hypothetical protein